VLEEGEVDLREQGVMVQPGPAPPLEVVEAQFLRELLVGLLADPSGFDRGGQCPQRRPHGMVVR
jgi:hypothetical protein